MEDKVATDEVRPSVEDVTKKFAVFEDGAYAHQVQEGLNSEHYQGNISRRHLVQTDLVVAKSQAEEEALEAFREEQEMFDKRRQIEERDNDTAREMYKEMMKEDAEKLMLEEENDKEIARELQLKEKEKFISAKKKQLERERESERLARSMSHEEKERQQRQKLSESEDALTALKLEVESENRVPDITDDELIAKQLQEHEKDKYLIAKKRHQEKRSLKESERLAMRLQLEEKEKAIRLRAARHSSQSSGNGRSVDEDDEEGEVRVRREPGVQDDENLARKMQHEEVLLAKNRRQKEHRRRVDGEVASPEDREVNDGRGQRHDPNYRPDQDRIHRYHTDRGHGPDRRYSQERGHEQDPERAHRNERETGGRHNSHRNQRHDSDRGQSMENCDRPRSRDDNSSNQVLRNPMVDSYTNGPDIPQGYPSSQIQPIPLQKRQTTKEREKDKKSKGFFSKKK